MSMVRRGLTLPTRLQLRAIGRHCKTLGTKAERKACVRDSIAAAEKFARSRGATGFGGSRRRRRRRR